MVKENTYGQMEDFTKENLKMTKCQDKEFILGLMEQNIKEIMSMILKKDSEYQNILMVKNMKDFGNQENSTEKENILMKIKQLKLENGMKVN